MAIREVVQEMLHQSIFVTPVLAMPNMDPNQDIEALAGSRNVSMFWGDPNGIVDHLVQLAVDRKVHITPTPASIAAQVQLVEPGLVLHTGLRPDWTPRSSTSTSSISTFTSPRADCRCWRFRRSSALKRTPVDLVEDGDQESPGPQIPQPAFEERAIITITSGSIRISRQQRR